MMQKKLVKHGNSYALVIERPILELLDIKHDMTLDISTDGIKIIIQSEMEKIDGISPELETFMIDMDSRYGEVLKHLA
jgi:antitoxin component of MazEF toxin-antitoxin module